MTNKEEYIQIDIKIIVVGLIAGVIASLWTIIPFFVSGAINYFYATVGLGAIFLFMFIGFSNKKKLIRSSGLAIGAFFLMSYLIVPFASGLLLNNEIDISQYENGDFETVNLALPGLFCEGCAYSSQSALKGIPGVIDAEVSFDDKSGTVVYDPNLVTPEEIVSNGLIQAYEGRIING